MSRVDNLKELRRNNILVVDDFLSKKVCKKILFQLTSNDWARSHVVQKEDANYLDAVISDCRTSQTLLKSGFSNKLENLISGFESKIIKQFPIKRKKLEGWQITKYGYKEKFDPHLDCLWAKNGNNVYGLRKKTVLLYLMAPQKGGETFFRAINLYVKPIQGRLVIWDNLLPNGMCNHGMIHGSLPVKKGVKIILNTWTLKEKK